nr:CCA tRNA nucleotidyltransferase [Sedimentibacter sp.]
MDIEIKMPEEAKKALNILKACGHEAYVVGGCVRDAILGSVPSDWDITTSALPDEISSCFKNYRTINTGLKHGTVTVVINKMHFEVTTYRIDGKYSDNRRPDEVTFTDKVAMDLKRRDFTINSLAYNKDGIVDLFGGIEDIKNKIVKCVGVPDERFQEDGLRILRAMRFAAVLGFAVEEKTRESIHKNKNLLRNISYERINSEFSKTMMGINCREILSEYKDVVEVFIPEISGLGDELWTERLNSAALVDNTILKLSLLFYGMDAELILRRLKSDNDTIKKVKLLTLNMDGEIIPEIPAVKRWINKLGLENLRMLIRMKNAGLKYSETEIKGLRKAEAIIDTIVKENQCYSLSTLAVKGTDLVAAGIPKGPKVGEILNEMLEKVIDDELENKKEALLGYANNKK